MRFALVFVLTTLVATCGQKGDLVLPEPPSEARLVEVNGAPALNVVLAITLANTEAGGWRQDA